MSAVPGDAAQGSEEDALQAGAPPGGLAPSWRVMLLSDGSVTRHLQLLTGLRVEVVRVPRFPSPEILFRF